MLDQKLASLVPGEASESDEDDLCSSNKIINIQNFEIDNSELGTVIAGEALESDEEIELPNIKKQTLKTRVIPFGTKCEKKHVLADISKLQSSSSRKSCERNKALHYNLISFKKNILISTNHELNNINQQLLKSQIELQQTLTNVRSVKIKLNEMNKKLNNIIVAGYIPTINIKVPAHII